LKKIGPTKLKKLTVFYLAIANNVLGTFAPKMKSLAYEKYVLIIGEHGQFSRNFNCLPL